MTFNLWFSIFPPLLAIILAAATRQVIPGLLLGLWLGSFIDTPGLLPSVTNTLDHIISTLSDRRNLDVLLFLYVFSGFIGMVQVAGGIAGFSR